ncbi:MAG: ATP-binding protein [Planctomycetota bacterium]|nr:ATP-binding protein [Planctomycetota bacterium]
MPSKSPLSIYDEPSFLVGVVCGAIEPSLLVRLLCCMPEHRSITVVLLGIPADWDLAKLLRELSLSTTAEVVLPARDQAIQPGQVCLIPPTAALMERDGQLTVQLSNNEIASSLQSRLAHSLQTVASHTGEHGAAVFLSSPNDLLQPEQIATLQRSSLLVIELSSISGESKRGTGTNRRTVGLTDGLLQCATVEEIPARILELYFRKTSPSSNNSTAKKELPLTAEQSARSIGELQQRVAELEKLLHVLPVGIGISRTSDCAEIELNPAAARMFGFPTGQKTVVHKNNDADMGFRMYQEGRELAAAEMPMQRAARLGAEVRGGEFTVVRADGTSLELIEYASPLFDANGQPRGCLGVYIDISIRKQLETKLRGTADYLVLQRQWLEAVLNLLPVPMLLIDPQTSRVTFANQAAGTVADAFRADSADVGNGTVYFTGLDGKTIPKDEMPVPRAARGEQLRAYEIQLHRPDGMRTIMINADTLPAMHNHDTVTVLVFQDITLFKQVETELRRTNEAKDALLAMLGHELRNPLAAITSSAELIQVLEPRDAEFGEARDILNSHLQHLVRLVDDILDVSRLGSGKIRMRKEVVNLRKVLEHSLQACESTIVSRQHSVRLEISDEPIEVHGDSARLEQVFVNLLMNAAKYTDIGGRITATIQTKNKLAEIRIQDTGIGIAKELLPQVFDLFLQLNPSLHRAEGGLGIGLNIVKNLVEAHGGTVSVLSEGAGKGSEFIVQLPRILGKKEPAERAPLETKRAAVPAAGSLRVLLVEDNADIAHTMGALIRIAGHQVEIAADGPSAWDLAKQNRPDIGFFDIGLPGMSGLELAKKFREDGELRKVFLVALTGFGQSADRRRSFEAGFDEHLVKPISYAKLQEILARPLTSESL